MSVFRARFLFVEFLGQGWNGRMESGRGQLNPYLADFLGVSVVVPFCNESGEEAEAE